MYKVRNNTNIYNCDNASVGDDVDYYMEMMIILIIVTQRQYEALRINVLAVTLNTLGVISQSCHCSVEV